MVVDREGQGWFPGHSSSLRHEREMFGIPVFGDGEKHTPEWGVSERCTG